MSIVTVKKVDGKWEAAADSITVRGYTQSKNKDSKLNRVGEFIIGTAGYASIGTLFFEYIGNHQPKSNTRDGWTRFLVEFNTYLKGLTDNFKDKDNDFLIIYRGKAWYLSGFYIDEVKKYQAIGAGMDYALGALYLGHDPKKAVEVACELSVYCEKPVKVLRDF